jgi:hypothetical protein
LVQRVKDQGNDGIADAQSSRGRWWCLAEQNTNVNVGGNIIILGDIRVSSDANMDAV